MAALHRVLYCERAPLYSESVFCWGSRRRLEARHLLLPLTNGGPDPAIALLGISFASDTAFPPLLRSLNTIAAHCETHRSVVSLPAPRAWQAAAGPQRGLSRPAARGLGSAGIAKLAARLGGGAPHLARNGHRRTSRNGFRTS